MEKAFLAGPEKDGRAIGVSAIPCSTAGSSALH